MHDRIEEPKWYSLLGSRRNILSNSHWTLGAGNEQPSPNQADGGLTSARRVVLSGKRPAKTVMGRTTLALVETNLARTNHGMDTKDPLSGLPDRGTLETMLHRSLKAWFRHGIPSCLVVVDLDYFKTVNEQLGAEAGDEVLRQMATLVPKNVRVTDSVLRYGGGAFAVVLPEVDLPHGVVLAERLRNTIERHAFLLNRGLVRITVSIGVTSLERAAIESVGQWIAAADAALKRAKSNGRNCVVPYGPVPWVPAHVALAVAA